MKITKKDLGKIIQETRFFDETTNTTTGMRSKEYAHDYRYFPEPDLVPVAPGKKWIEEIKKTLGELPEARKNRFITNYQLTTNNSQLLISNKAIANFFEECAKLYNKPKIIANWILGDLSAYLNEDKKSIDQVDFTPTQLVEILELIDKGTISGKIFGNVNCIYNFF